VGRNLTIAFFAAWFVLTTYFAVKQVLIVRGHFLNARWPCVVSEDRGEEIATAVSLWVLVAFFAFALVVAA
jgi:hypothetical protein